MTVAPWAGTAVDFVVDEVSGDDVPRVIEGYDLLREALGATAVEVLGSFRGTVSRATDASVIPKLVCASTREQMIGFSVGAHLRNLNVGFIAYSAVRKGFRRQGVYTSMRGELVSLINRESAGVDDQSRGIPATSAAHSGGHGVLYMISELDEDSPLYKRYLTEWNAFVAPCTYEQPAAQGLHGKQLKLVLQPVARRTPPGEDQTVAIVREVYRRIYRIQYVDENDAYRRVAASVGRTATVHD